MNHSKRLLTRGAAGLLSIGMLGGMLAGCGGDKDKDTAPSATPGSSTSAGSSTAPTAAPAGPLKLSFTTPLYDAQPYKLDGNEIFEAFEELTNTDISINFVPNANYSDKLNLSLAGGDLTQVMTVPGSFIKSTTFVNAARGGMFWDLTDELDKYPNLSKNINEITRTNTSVDGRIYGVPQPRPTARVGLLYRKDWFDSLGIKVPTTLDEFYTAAKELKEKMPDITPFSFCDQITEAAWNGIDLLTVSQGGYNVWGLKDGKLEPYYETSEYLDVLNTFKKMYSEGLMNKDFAIVQGAQKKNAISTGKSAMYISAYDDLNGIQNSLVKIDPNAKLDLQPVFNEKTNSTSGHNGMFVLPKSIVKTQEEVDAILTYFNRSSDQDALTLYTFGIEGKTYNLVDGVPAYVDEEAQTKAFEDRKPIALVYSAPAVARWANDAPLAALAKEAQEKYASIAVPNLAEPFVSATVVEKGGDLDKIVYDARVKYIMGEIDEKGYSSAIASWRSLGGDKIIEEFTEAYNKAN